MSSKFVLEHSSLVFTAENRADQGEQLKQTGSEQQLENDLLSQTGVSLDQKKKKPSRNKNTIDLFRSVQRRANPLHPWHSRSVPRHFRRHTLESSR